MAPKISDRRLLDAVVKTVVEHGYAGATTRQIAAEAGVNEVTLFRRFGDKRRLMLAAVHADIGEFAASGTCPSDDLEADLRGILAYYDSVFREHGQLLLVLMTEAARNPELGEIVREPMGVQVELRRLIEHHQQAGRLIVEPPGIALQALIGPLLARTVVTLLEPEVGLPPASVDELLDRFLGGHGNPPVKD